MRVNRSRPHIFVLPEDDANKDILNGFFTDPSTSSRQVHIAHAAGGWIKVRDQFLEEHVSLMDQNPQRLMILLIDLDNDTNRLDSLREKIPSHLQSRVFILSTLSEPEDLKAALGSLEKIGLAMALDCREGTSDAWQHPLLRHNEPEVLRLRESACSILFPNA